MTRSDRTDAVAWLLLGAVTVVGAWRMDRLDNQDVPPFGAPGLLPGLLGVLLVLMGGVLLLQSLRAPPGPAGEGLLGPAPGRALWVMGLCVVFGAVLVGHGLPFWAASTVFVAVAILSLRQSGRGIGPASVATALAIGLGAGLGITAVFQQIFLVRLP